MTEDTLDLLCYNLQVSEPNKKSIQDGPILLWFSFQKY